jgi:hypothetical protein
MTQRMITIILMIGLITSLSVLSLTAQQVRPPGNQQGYAPEQPIAFSHRLHSGDLAIDCRYCHTAAGTSRNSGIPPASTCMNCHRFVTSTIGAVRAEEALALEQKRDPVQLTSVELKKLYDSVGLNSELKPDPTKTPKSLEWIKVHNLPDFVYFNHSAHVTKGVACQTCHGPVETMEKVRQQNTLSMGWCVNCHRASNLTSTPLNPINASTSCVTCHF